MERSLKGIAKSVAAYSSLLNEVDDEMFARTPAPGVWSYAEVYAHIFRSNMLCFSVIGKCAKGEGVESSRSLSLPVQIVLFMRRFPPTMKFKVPEKLTYMVEKVSKDDARKLLDDFAAGVNQCVEMVKKASKTQRMKHPRMGMMNAEEWLAFIDMHTRHHARQLKRIQRMHA